jgi:membrane protein DedA with SNARE-associated domain
MLEWLHSLLPGLPHYGFAIVFVVVFLSNLGIPLAGKAILLAAGFVLGQNGDSLWPPMAAGSAGCVLGGICAFAIGRRLDDDSLEKLRWLRLTPAKLKRPRQFFKRHGPKAVLMARIIPFFPPFLSSLLAGVAKMHWRTFLFYDFIGSLACGIGYILIGYLFGQKWKALEAWLGPVPLYLILTAITLTVLGVFFRQPLAEFWTRHVAKKSKRK